MVESSPRVIYDIKEAIHTGPISMRYVREVMDDLVNEFTRYVCVLEQSHYSRNVLMFLL